MFDFQSDEGNDKIMTTDSLEIQINAEEPQDKENVHLVSLNNLYK